MPSDELTQDEVLRRLTALLVHVGNSHPPEMTDEDTAWRQGLLSGICLACGVAAGAGAVGEIPINDLALIGFDVARSVDWTLTND